MSTEAAPTTTTQAAPIAPTPSASAPSEADIAAAMDALSTMTAAEIEAIESGQVPAVTPEPQVEAKPSEAAPEVKKDEPGVPERDPSKVGRLSLSGLSAESRSKLVEFKTLVAGGMPEDQAAAKIFGVTQPQQPEQKQEEPAAAAEVVPQEPPAELKAIQDEVVAKMAEIKQIKTAYGDATDAIIELNRLERKLERAQEQHERQASTEQQFQAEADKSLRRAMAEHSELWSNAKAGFAEKCDDEFVLASHKNDPILEQPDWPEKIAKRVKEKYFSRSDVQNADDGDEEPTIPPLPNQMVRLPGSLTGTTAVPGTLSEGGILAAFDSLTLEQQDAVLGM